MKRSFLFLLISFSISLWSSDFLTLSGSPSQGGILLGKVSSQIEIVLFDYEKVNVKDQRFLLGFERDAKLHHIITIVHKDGRMFSRRFQLRKREYPKQELTITKKEFVSKPKTKEFYERLKKESNELKAARKRLYQNQKQYFQEFLRPVNGGRISSEFGAYRIINDVPKKPHLGLDIALPIGTPVFAMADGKVELTGDYYYNGRFVLLDHGVGLSSIYIHLNKISVYDDDFVKMGDKIGEVGSTGRSTGQHLHWGVYLFETALDPQLILDFKENFVKIAAVEKIQQKQTKDKT